MDEISTVYTYNNRYTMETTLANIDRLKEELAALVAMSETEACQTYKVDHKAEAVPYIVDYWM